MRFFKMQNCGNDYIFVFNRLNAKQIKLICNRNFGIGGDGVVYLYNKNGLFGYEIYNSDASKASFCGSVTLCLGLYLFKKYGIKNRCLITDAGLKKVEVLKKLNGLKVGVEVGKPRFRYNFNGKNGCVIEQEFTLLIKGKTLNFTGGVVNVGNLHLVINKACSPSMQEEIVNEINQSKIFKNGVNVEFVQLKNGVAEVDVYERGSGKTLCCSSGACAVFAFFNKKGMVENELKIKFRGGNVITSMKNGKVWVHSFPQFLYYGNWRGEYDKSGL